ncbi:glycerophosphodiester phosphodiesterase [Streptomyces sp. NPDC046939]|uniref:glycerophosphodiester phosphodiesterase n=1 Tax=Streptomyces sp. NPDC046939 TaxID=3155376 RepID=UPI0033E62CBE
MGATQITDLRYTDGSPTDSLTADENGMIPSFLGPEMSPPHERVWVDFGGARVALLATDVGERLSAHVTAEDPHGSLERAANAVSARMGVPGGLAPLNADGGVSLTNVVSPPAESVSNGGVLYAEGGALKWKGSNGTVTTIAEA